MDEEFKVVDIKSFVGKEKTSYFLVIYSSLEYCFRAYMNEETYNLLLPHKDELSKDFDVSSNVHKIYNEKSKSFSYFVRLTK